VVAFLLAFVVLSGVLGPRIISSGLINRDGFWVYGAAGKVLLFFAIAFLVLAHKKLLPDLGKWQPKLLGWAAASALSLAGAWVGVNHLIHRSHDIWWALATHLFIIASVKFAFLACFGIGSIRPLLRHYKTELIYSSAAAALFYALLTAFYASWSFFASVVLHAVRALLDATGLAATVLPPHTLVLDKFGVSIAQSCSGVESMALFTGLYLVVWLMDRSRLNLRRYILIFPAALAALFGFNILRVYLLILGGYYINPEIAFSLFHTYAGMLVFIIFSLIFWKLAYKHLLKPKTP
jgi:exosortase/archaeosortase family protein